MVIMSEMVSAKKRTRLKATFSNHGNVQLDIFTKRKLFPFVYTFKNHVNYYICVELKSSPALCSELLFSYFTIFNKCLYYKSAIKLNAVNNMKYSGYQ